MNLQAKRSVFCARIGDKHLGMGGGHIPAKRFSKPGPKPRGMGRSHSFAERLILRRMREKRRRDLLAFRRTLQQDTGEFL